jgi:hypothetical protein
MPRVTMSSYSALFLVDGDFGRKPVEIHHDELGVICSGRLRAGFADLQQLPTVVQVNAAVQIAFHVPGVGR